MRVYLFRHATAIPPGTPGYAEEERPLTEAGHAQARAAAAGLKRLKIVPDALVSSPLRRAMETADEAARVFGAASVKALAALRPETPPAEASLALRPWASQEHVILFGHEPHMSLWLAELVAPGGLRCDFKKAGVACVELDRVPPPPGSGTLRWLMTPKALAKIGNA